MLPRPCCRSRAVLVLSALPSLLGISAFIKTNVSPGGPNRDVACDCCFVSLVLFAWSHNLDNGSGFDTNLLHQHLKPVGKNLGMPWLNWHTLRRTHATLFQQAGGTLREAQAQLGHSKMSTTLEIYTISIPQAQRKAVENLSDLVTSGDELAKLGENLPLATERIQ